MPAELQPRAASPSARVAVSAIVELEYSLFALPSAHEPESTYGHPHPELKYLLEPFPELAHIISRFWDDGCSCWSEVLLFAHRTGTLLDDRPARFFARLDQVMQEEFAVPELPSESMEVRGIVEARLQKLRSSAETRACYQSLLRQVWDMLEPLWEKEGHAAAMRTAASLRERLAERPEIALLLPKHHFALREQFVPLVERAIRRGEAVLIPMALAGTGLSFFALPGVLIIAFGPEAGSKAQQGRKLAEASAASFKVLSDPTRLAILKTLLEDALTITDLAQLYELSQPTVSVHMKTLRLAGLVEPEQRDGRTLYRASREKTRAFVAAAVGDI